MYWKVFGADDDIKTPAITKWDGVDFMPMSTWEVFTIQFLNIAGLEPVFGAMIAEGSVALIWAAVLVMHMV